MKNNLRMGPSEFRNRPGIVYFNFEEDFVEENVRCIPMIVRFKMDAAGIKLKLAEWSKFTVEERLELARRPCNNERNTMDYYLFLSRLIRKKTGRDATELMIDKNPLWADTRSVPALLNERIKEFQDEISIEQWQGLGDLQRFALMKLCKAGHENKNLPKAIKEFNLVN